MVLPQILASLTGVLAVIGGTFSIIAILAAAYVWFRSAGEKATIESQGRLLAARKEEIEDLTRRVGAVEAENVHLRETVMQVKGIDLVQATADLIKADTAAIRAKVVPA